MKKDKLSALNISLGIIISNKNNKNVIRMNGNRWRAGRMAVEFAANKHIPAIIELNCMQITQCNKEQSKNFIYLFI